MATLIGISGDGQVLAPGFPGSALRVRLDDLGGPIVGATVTWSVGTGGGSLSNYTSITDAGGYAESTYSGNPYITIAQSWIQETVTASAAGASDVSFYATTTTRTNSGFAVWPTVDLINPPAGTGFIGNPSGTIVNGLQLTVRATSGADTGVGIPNIAVWITSGDPATEPTASIGSSMTDSSGLRTDVSIGAVVGTAEVTIQIGGFSSFTILLTVLGDAASATAYQGNDQHAFSGETFSQDLVVRVLQSSGSPSVGSAVVWAVVTPGSLSIDASEVTTDSQGQASATVSAGGATGTYQVTATVGGNTATFDLTIDDAGATQTLEVVSGNGQSAMAGAAFTYPLVVQVLDGIMNPVPGVTVTFAVASGSVTLSAATVDSSASGYASVTATAGSLAGAARVTVSIAAGSSVRFSLTVTVEGTTPGDSHSGGGGDSGGSGGALSGTAALRMTGSLTIVVSNPPTGGWVEPDPDLIPDPDAPTLPGCLAEYDKHPDDVLDIVVDWEPWLDGDTIVTSVWDGDGLTVNASSSTTTTTTVNLSGGIQDQTYSPKNTTTSSAGRTEVRRIRVSVKAATIVGAQIQIGWTRGTPS